MKNLSRTTSLHENLIRQVLTAGLIILIGVGCSSSDSSTNPTGQAPRIRLLHMVYDGNTLDLRVDGQLISTGTTFGNSSGYYLTKSGQWDVSVHNQGDVNARASSKQSMSDGNSYSVYAFPPNNAFAAGFQSDPVTTTADKARIKIVNASSDLDTFELRITGSRTTLLGPVARTKVTTYADVFAGSYRFSLRKPKDTTWSMEFEAVDLQGQGAYTAVIHGTLSDSDPYQFGVRMFTDNGEGTTYVDWVKSPSISKLLYVNAAVGAANVDVAVDGSVSQIKSLAFGFPCPYMTLASGTHTYSVASGATPIITNQNVSLTATNYYSTFITGTLVPPNVAPLTLVDETAPDASAALVRFVHLIPDAPAVEVYIKDLLGPNQDYKIPGIDGVGFRQTSVSTDRPGSAFLKFSPPGTYTLKFEDASSKAVILEASNITFEAGKIYTLWIGGSTAAKTVKAYLVNHN